MQGWLQARAFTPCLVNAEHSFFQPATFLPLHPKALNAALHITHPFQANVRLLVDAEHSYFQPAIDNTPHPNTPKHTHTPCTPARVWVHAAGGLIKDHHCSIHMALL